jgi:hypothetical protein
LFSSLRVKCRQVTPEAISRQETGQRRVATPVPSNEGRHCPWIRSSRGAAERDLDERPEDRRAIGVEPLVRVETASGSRR